MLVDIYQLVQPAVPFTLVATRAKKVLLARKLAVAAAAIVTCHSFLLWLYWLLTMLRLPIAAPHLAHRHGYFGQIYEDEA